MIILNEQSLKERGTEYITVSPKQAWDTLCGSIKEYNEFQIHLGFLTGGLTSMEARYDKVKSAGGQIGFRDVKNAMNRMDLSFRDIASAEIGEDIDEDFRTIRLDLKSKAFVTITPF
jgi:hypothetical protein